MVVLRFTFISPNSLCTVKIDIFHKMTKSRSKTSFFLNFFKKNFGGHKAFCVGLLIPQFWTSGDVCPGFQSQGGFPCLCASSPVHNGFLRFTSGVTPVDCTEVSMAAEPF